MWPSQIKKLVARAERSNEPSTTALRRRRQTTTDTTEIPPTEILGRIFISERFFRRESKLFSKVQIDSKKDWVMKRAKSHQALGVLNRGFT